MHFTDKQRENMGVNRSGSLDAIRIVQEAVQCMIEGVREIEVESVDGDTRISVKVRGR